MENPQFDRRRGQTGDPNQGPGRDGARIGEVSPPHPQSFGDKGGDEGKNPQKGGMGIAPWSRPALLQT